MKIGSKLSRFQFQFQWNHNISIRNADGRIVHERDKDVHDQKKDIRDHFYIQGGPYGLMRSWIGFTRMICDVP